MLTKTQKLVSYLHFSEFRHLYAYFHSFMAWKMLSLKSHFRAGVAVHALDPSVPEADAVNLQGRRALRNETLFQIKQTKKIFLQKHQHHLLREHSPWKFCKVYLYLTIPGKGHVKV